jgi:hypothetical protein
MRTIGVQYRKTTFLLGGTYHIVPTMRVWFLGMVAALFLGCQVNGEVTGAFSCTDDPRCPAGYSCVGGKCVVPTAACATSDQLSTQFDGAAVPPWAAPRSFAGGTVAVVAGIPGNASAGVDSKVAYDLRSRTIEFEVTAVGGDTTAIGLIDTSGAAVDLGVTQGTRIFALSKGRTVIERLYSPVNDRWWRFRTDGPDLVWETSSDRASWTLLAKDFAPLDLQWVIVRFALSANGGPAGSARLSAVNPGRESSVNWCPLSSWTESFNDGLAPPYSKVYGERCDVAEVGGKLTMTTTGLPGSCFQRSNRPLDARDGSIASEVLPAGPSIATGMTLNDDASANFISMEATDMLRFRVRAAGTDVFNASVALDPSAQRFWRLAQAGTMVRFEVSGDAATWQTLASTNVPTLDASAMFIERSTYIEAPASIPTSTTAAFGELLR